YEIMLSESQERMLMVIRPEARARARAIFEKWELDFAEIGRLTDTGRLVLTMGGKVQADLPVAPLVEQAPVYDRPIAATPARPALPAASIAMREPVAALEQLIGSPDLASRRWIWEQYDHLVMGQTGIRPGGDAAVVRIGAGPKGLAVSIDCTPRYCHADPETGGAQAVAESWRNLIAVGAKPLAITDNMNFGNPQRPEIMGQFAGCIEGMRKACLALDYPVVSGNVSFYNETNGKGILPTPVIGGVGLVADVAKTVSIAFKAPGEAIVLLGETKGHLGCSLYLREILGREEGPPPPVDLEAERRIGEFIRGRIAAGRLTACHDLADGGLLVGLAEMALAGRIGAEIALAPGIPAHAFCFGEDQGRYLATLPEASLSDFLAAAHAAGVPASPIGRTGGNALTLQRGNTISLARLAAAHEGFLPRLMGS
ncbi:MAG TPA: AIR synthase-related protein, partial [Dongiaceae bacterium]|nr:AIR synthase-related protein [Dongiaceae bacterium]